MNYSEIAFWNRKVKLLENTSQTIKYESGTRPVSFYEGIALYLSKAYLQIGCDAELEYGHLTQRAA